jgi:hypothetical protein
MWSEVESTFRLLGGELLAVHVLGLYERTLVALAKSDAQRDWTAVRGLIREVQENVVVVARLAGTDGDRQASEKPRASGAFL